MGIDAEGCFYTKEVLTKEELKKLNEDFINACFDGWERNNDIKKDDLFCFDNKPFKPSGDKPNKYVIDYGLHRHWGPGYERGPFETIIAPLGWLRRRQEVERVFYWGDIIYEDEASEFTEEQESYYINHWFTHGNPYRYRG